MASNEARGGAGGRRIPMRLWLGAAFAGVTMITAFAVYIFVDDSSGRTLQSESSDLAVGRTTSVADALEAAQMQPGEAAEILDEANTENFEVWAINRKGGPFAPAATPPRDLRTVQGAGDASAAAKAGRRYRLELPGDNTLASAPIFGAEGVRGTVVVVAEPPPALARAFDDLQGDRLRALAIAIGVGVVVGFIVSSLITIRIKRLARSAEQMAAGRFDAPLPPAGIGDEVGDLTRSLDTMREALRDSFDALATERDRLSAVFEGLREAVIVVGDDGEVRFSNQAAERLVRGGRPAMALIPALRRAAEEGSDEVPELNIEDRVYAVQARRVAAEHAVLMVVRDRTDELKRAEAEREFVSNAAHELRNPLAGISGAIEVLRGGAKNDPEARDRFLARLADDAERMTRLTQALLTLARVEAADERDAADVVDVTMAAEEAAGTVERPPGVEIVTEVDSDLVAEGDPVLLRQVLVGLLSNACRHTPAPGRITVRGARGDTGVVTIEVEDTGKGIAPAEQDRIFERFYRGRSGYEGYGFGLGLSIAKRMVDVMGGEIGVTSEPGRGATFWVRLRQPKPTATPVA
ncbi:MAG TPA: ATP-binding protein [Solirubrobacterales bacterium]|jgi:two-component system phosphate regulon sensor histidine kinase PhoR|nr:ATP-binding protein [Solirubrobacterales bacterium]